MSKDGTLPPGVEHSDPHFNPPTCPNCGEETIEGEDCESCGEYVKTEEDWADEAADREVDRMMEEGRGYERALHDDFEADHDR